MNSHRDNADYDLRNYLNGETNDLQTFDQNAMIRALMNNQDLNHQEENQTTDDEDLVLQEPLNNFREPDFEENLMILNARHINFGDHVPDVVPDFLSFLHRLHRDDQIPSTLLHRLLAFTYTKDSLPFELTPELISRRTDSQGIPWFPDTSVEKEVENQCLYDIVRNIRKQLYHSYRNIPGSRATIVNSITTRVSPSVPIFTFKSFFTRPKPKIVHFQLRDLVVPISQYEIYYSSDSDNYETFSLERLNPVDKEIIVVANPFMGKLPSTKYMNVSTIAANNDMLVAGGFEGQFFAKRLFNSPIDEGVIEHSLSTDLNGITNHIELVKTSNSSQTNKAVFCINDEHLRIVDFNRLDQTKNIKYPWAPNCTSTCPTSDGQTRVVVGDCVDAFITDDRINSTTNSNTVSKFFPVMTLSGHADFGFGCAWSPNGKTIATSNQDGTCRVFDIRNPKHATNVIDTHTGNEARKICFDSEGKYLAIAEPVDYVTVFDTETLKVDTSDDINKIAEGQIVEFWGEVAGMGFLDSESDRGKILTIGISDSTVPGILQYEIQSDIKGLSSDYYF